jgi:hypothetical protein
MNGQGFQSCLLKFFFFFERGEASLPFCGHYFGRIYVFRGFVNPFNGHTSVQSNNTRQEASMRLICIFSRERSSTGSDDCFVVLVLVLVVLAVFYPLVI